MILYISHKHYYKVATGLKIYHRTLREIQHCSTVLVKWLLTNSFSAVSSFSFKKSLVKSTLTCQKMA
eukprot:m.33574 g.33574  ORF g.33574 m.33574 type:complete len:67 (+) comp31847_c0_seq1:2542-2742(+)